MTPNSLDHVALWVAERDRLASFLCQHLGMHEIERTDAFTLLGVDAKLGKLTLFAAEGPRDAGVLELVVLRVRDLDAAASRLSSEAGARREDGTVLLEAPEGLRLALVEVPESVDYDLDHVVLRVPDPDASATALAELGFERRGGTLAVADRELRLAPGGRPEGERPLLNHLAVLVDSAEAWRAEAERRGAEIADFVDAPNTLAAFVWGPDRIKLEYVEHKPGFSLT
ncbi:MAG TPA: VOC family protein [Thermoleophilaceae bacterium]|nr:VOC family protein [Thermoleophilaceae bacterium]